MKGTLDAAAIAPQGGHGLSERGISLRTDLDPSRIPPGHERASHRPGVVPRGTRWAVSAFLGAFIFTGLVGIEMWPLTGWKLFSQLRKAHAVSWQVVRVDAAGNEKPIPFDLLPRGYHDTLHVLKTFEALDATAKGAVCRTWERALVDLRVEGREILIYRIEVHRSISPDGRHAPTIARTPRYRCLDGRVEEIRGPG